MRWWYQDWECLVAILGLVLAILFIVGGFWMVGNVMCEQNEFTQQSTVDVDKYYFFEIKTIENERVLIVSSKTDMEHFQTVYLGPLNVIDLGEIKAEQ